MLGCDLFVRVRVSRGRQLQRYSGNKIGPPFVINSGYLNSLADTSPSNGLFFCSIWDRIRECLSRCVGALQSVILESEYTLKLDNLPQEWAFHQNVKSLPYLIRCIKCSQFCFITGLVFVWFTADGLAAEIADLCDIDGADNDKPALDPYIFVGMFTNRALEAAQPTWVEKGEGWKLMMPLDHKATQRK